MLVELARGLWFTLFTAKVNRRAEGLMVLATWLLAVILLCVSVPHSVEVIWVYEHGDAGFRTFKAIALSLVIEVIAALALLVALHTKGFTDGQRQLITCLA